MSTHLRSTLRSPNPVLNIPRRNEAVATDTLSSSVGAIDNGAKVAQIFVGVDTKVIDIFCAKSASQFPDLLMDCIRRRGRSSTIRRSVQYQQV